MSIHAYHPGLGRDKLWRWSGENAAGCPTGSLPSHTAAHYSSIYMSKVRSGHAFSPAEVVAMSLRPDLLGSTSGPVAVDWNADDLLLYALGVGAGQDDPLAELDLTTENTTGTAQRALPIYCVVLAQRTPAVRIPYGDVDRSKLVHAEQAVQMHRPLPLSGSVELSSRVSGVVQKRSGVVVSTETVGADPTSGAPVFTTRQSAFMRGLTTPHTGEDRLAPAPPWQLPDHSPDLTVVTRTRPDQALLYRLCGDRNPLHSDPAYAARGGFERPILHGMCTYGFTGRILISALCDGDPDRLASISARFTKPVFPGGKLTVSAWTDGDRYLFRTTDDAGDVVLDRGVLVTR
jgi:acyl dehydratase